MVSNYSLADKFAVMAILTLPYDSIPHILPFVYRPLSLYFIAIAFFLYMFQDRGKVGLSRAVKQILFFALVTLVLGTFVLLHNVEDYYGLKFYAPSLLVGMLSVWVFSKFIQKHHCPELNRDVLKYVGYAYIFAMIIGSLETLSCFRLLPYDLKTPINAFFGGWQPGRPCLTNSEASYASQHMCFAVLIFTYLYKHLFQKKWFYCAVWAGGLLLITASAKGFIVLIMTLLLYGLFSSIIRGKLQSFLVKAFVVASLLLLLCFAIYQIMLLYPDTYFSRRILNFSGITNMVETDTSAFVRIGLPVLALRMFLDSPLLGLGAGGFHVFALDYISEYMPFAMNLTDVVYMRTTGKAMSCPLIFQVLANFGVYGFYLFIRPLATLWKQNKMNMRLSETTILLFSYFTVQFFQNGNWAYMQIWLLFALFARKNVCNKDAL